MTNDQKVKLQAIVGAIEVTNDALMKLHEGLEEGEEADKVLEQQRFLFGVMIELSELA
jgi:hypothetical protein